ncbi:reverse transcriptase [Gossypium australe]|uniref:Reverse transcriptase n=1 Tax=Gossypium australe TaxID=47621 RepID=A0A5B6VDT3_9ROSI|nr:reverse transcriptase [Gossypium australe]
MGLLVNGSHRREGFSTLLNEAKQKDLMRGPPIGRERLSINHLFFANDCILFGDASSDGANMVQNIIQEYELTSGQWVNFDKSLIYFGANVESKEREVITNILSVLVASNPEKYLGLPMMVGRKKRWAFANFVDHFRKRIDGWSLRYLSMGKKVFVKSVLQAIPIYVTQCFALPKNLCQKLEGIMNKFWWSNNKSAKGIHWSNWNALCKPKCVGGLGFRDLFLLNKALLAKQVWCLSSQPNCLLSKVLKARYYPFSDILSAKRSICSARDLIADGILWHIGSCACVNMWNDPWLPSPGNSRLVDDDQANRIFSIPFSGARLADMLVWKHEATGEYSVKSGYRVLVTEQILSNNYNLPNADNYKDFYKTFWTMHIPAKIKIHMWRLFNNLVPHFYNLYQRRLNVDIVCSLCEEALEDSDHLMWSCGILQQLWASLHITLAPAGSTSICKTRPMLKELWRPPNTGTVKLNFDASFQSVSRTSIAVVLARNSEGEILGACTYPFEDVVDAFVAEARACERALLFAFEMGFRRLLLEGDSFSIIKNLKSTGEDKSILRPITHSIRILESYFEEVSYLFVPRAVNRTAHTLALEGRRRQISCFWVDGASDSVRKMMRTGRFSFKIAKFFFWNALIMEKVQRISMDGFQGFSDSSIVSTLLRIYTKGRYVLADILLLCRFVSGLGLTFV